jgi:hypothetical protein
MCLPTKDEQSSSSPATGAFSILGIGGGLMLLACVGAPLMAGALGSLGAGVLLGAGGVVFAIALCAAVPAVMVAMRRRAARRRPTAEL